jgi:hypothetical protein
VLEDRRSIDVSAPPPAVFREVAGIGGVHGYPAANFLWRLRGIMDRLVGGPGLRRGRRHPDTLAYGDALDFWRVTALEPGRRLELRAEMRLPGVATLTFDVEPGEGETGMTRLEQTARFKPRGLAGIAYWYAVLPLHGIVFRLMLRSLARSAEQRAARESADNGAQGRAAEDRR